MTDQSFGGSSNDSAYSQNSPLSSSGVSLPSGRKMLNGSDAILIVGLSAYVAGKGGTASVRLELGSAKTSNFSRSAGSGGSSTGMKSTSTDWLTSASSATFKVYMDDWVYFSRGTSGSTTDDSGYTWTGRIGGSFRYYEASSAPRSLVVEASGPTALRYSYVDPDGHGGTDITGYRIQYADNVDFTNAVSVDVDGKTTSGVLEGLTPGKTYYVRAASKNRVTDEAKTTSVWSAAKSASLVAGAGVSDGNAYTPGVAYVSDGTAWNAVTVSASDGTAWQPTT